jgi:hypothetical protein
MRLLPNDDPSRRWVLARDVARYLASLYGHPATAQDAVTEHAAGRLIITRCARLTVHEDDGDGHSDDDGLVPFEFWERYRSPSARRGTDWAAGNFAIHQRPEHGIGWETVRLYGVEFCAQELKRAFSLPDLVGLSPLTRVSPVGRKTTPDPLPRRDSSSPAASAARSVPAPPSPRAVPSIQGAPGPSPGGATRYMEPAPEQISPPRGGRANPMTDREIKAWHRSLSRAEKTLGVLALWKRAKEDNPGRHIPRKLVEQFGEGRSNGHRAKTKSSPNLAHRFRGTLRGTH